MLIKFKKIPDWKFDIDEVSAGVYKVTGVDGQKRNVEAIGTDPNVLIEKCKHAALQILKMEPVNRIRDSHE